MATKKEVVARVNLQVPVAKANPAPPIGTALGPRGVNIMDFCKQFNALKFNYEQGTPIPVVISIYKDKSFTFITKEPPITFLIKDEIGLKKGSSNSGKDSAGMITMKQIENVAKKKIADMNTKDIKACMAMVRGSALSMGLQVIEEEN
ncbi:MAG: 50S ribosomal protein L11 [Rickettsiales bacterium]|jgi:large subunit ribosomal protein L11|nr:50S ribosomal protein L11 [Rickettsiales bacterium]